MKDNTLAENKVAHHYNAILLILSTAFIGIAIIEHTENLLKTITPPACHSCQQCVMICIGMDFAQEILEMLNPDVEDFHKARGVCEII